VTTAREQVLSEFIDAWNAGRRPEVDDYIARVPEAEQAELANDLFAFLTLAPTPEYSEEALAAITAESVVAETLGAGAERAGVLAALIARLRERLGMSTADVAGELVGELGLREEQAPKAAGYLERLEQGRLEPSRISRKVFEALGRLFGVPSRELEDAADYGGWSGGRLAHEAAPVFRADEDAAASVARHLDVLADALAAPGGDKRDEVDDLFLGGR
jgi:transcriptional regulator with XRE-family HTH domain